MRAKSFRIAEKWRRSVLVAIILVVAGCGPSGPKIVPVSGQVMIDGEPMAAGVVGYVQVVPSEGRAASGTIDPETGRFKLTTWKEGDGCIVGTHRVTVTVRQTVGVESISLIPENYDDLSKTDLEVTIDGPIDSLVIELTGPLKKARTDAAPISDDPNRF
jgi:hypothetical protein